MNEIVSLLRSVERTNLLMGAMVLLVGGLIWGPTFALASIALGTVLGALNFRAVSFIARRIASGSEARKTAFFLLFLAKFGVLIAVCWLLVVVVEVVILPFLIGISTIIAALMLASFRHVALENNALQKTVPETDAPDGN